VLQAACGGVLYGGLAQAAALLKLANEIGFLMFITLAALALVAAVLAAYWKYQYKMWDVKRPLPGDPAERKEQWEWSKRDLKRTRRALFAGGDFDRARDRRIAGHDKAACVSLVGADPVEPGRPSLQWPMA
jgi:hypothetical protein